MILLCLIPLVIRLVVLPFAGPFLNDDLISTGYMADSYTYYKWLFLIAISLVFLTLFLYRLYILKEPVKKSYISIPIFLLCSWLVLSLFTAEYKNVALKGFYDRHEGTLTYLCFLAIVFCIANMKSPSEKIFQYAAICFSFPILLNSVVVLCYFWGLNVAKFKFIEYLIVPEGIKAKVKLDNIFFNVNYSSGISCAACYFYFAIAMMTKNTKAKTAAIAMLFIVFASLLCSLSTSGFLTFVVFFPFFFLVCFRMLSKKSTTILALVCLVFFAIIGVFLDSTQYKHGIDPSFSTEETSTIYKESLGGILNLAKNLVPKKTQTRQQEKKFKENALDFPKEEELEEFSFPPYGYGIGTGRLYLWKLTLEMIRKRPLFGYGMDTFAFYCPHYRKDKICNLNTTDSILITKPHNFYLAVAFGAGIPAMIFLIALLGIHFTKSFFAYKNCANPSLFMAHTAIFFFLISFSFQWLFNDSVLPTSIFFWCFLGLGVQIVRQMDFYHE